MARYVDADKWEPYFYEHMDDAHMIAAKNALDDMPTEDVVKRKNGNWVFIGGYVYRFRCSICRNCEDYRSNFCPKCGARMLPRERII